jgi:hypothetical protein
MEGEDKMAVPKYVGVYFPAGVRTKKETVIKRFKALEKSRWGYKTTEYKQLKRYLKTQRRK